MDILDGLTPAQAEAVTHVDGPLLVLAGAGSGKTRVITRRIAHLLSRGIPAGQVLAITFTNKAAGEMRQRTEALVPGARRPLVSTFHSFCARMLREHGDLLDLDPSYTIYDMADQAAAIKRALAQLSLDPTHFDPGKAAEQISRAKSNLQRARDYAATPRSDYWARHLARIYEAYEAILAESHALDFDDLLLEVALGLRDREEFRARLHERFHYILIDEYQDTNHAQYVIARDLAGPRRNLCATGDPDQSIYGWRGAELSNILDFEDDFPDARVVRLERNYRSTKTILAAADNVIRHNLRRKPKALFTENEAGPPIAIVRTDDEEAEADTVARRIASLHREGLAYRDIAVFV
ncbi:MAG: UvrD-helicase domain-containing protein, partial [Planctomycetes bacterium]|nr:UvrD-helicase domain-containing protein [Planctomycetota bacterium]